jgi:hypothetical protein
MKLPQSDFALTPTARADLERRFGVKKVRAKATPAEPGSGPSGETCGSCRNKYRTTGFARTYLKCALVPPTRGPGTDIRAKTPACARWERLPPRGA